MREGSRKRSIFFDSKTPMGRGWLRASTLRTAFLFSGLTGGLLTYLPLSISEFRPVVIPIAALTLVCLVFWATLIFFNWPKYLSPKAMREQPGAVEEWVRPRAHDRRRKRGQK
jgi:hypothetical protein